MLRHANEENLNVDAAKERRGGRSNTLAPRERDTALLHNAATLSKLGIEPPLYSASRFSATQPGKQSFAETECGIGRDAARAKGGGERDSENS